MIVLYLDLSFMYWPCFRKLNKASFELQTKPFFVLNRNTKSNLQGSVIVDPKYQISLKSYVF